MATYTPSTPIGSAQLGRGGAPPVPPRGGGDDGNSSGSPNYGARLRRARLGLICAVATVCMVFISLTRACVGRQGLPTFDEVSRTYWRYLGEGRLLILLFAINTVLLLVSIITIQVSRSDASRQ